MLTNNPGAHATQRLNAALVKLQGLLQGGSVSQEALSDAITDAVVAISAVSAESNGLNPQRKIEKLWHEVEHYNKEIEDGFGKMRKAGIVFDSQLWEKHRNLLERLHNSPHDLASQKELDAVDDALLHEAEPQLDAHPAARKFYNDVKKQSEQRHKLVDEDLELAAKELQARNAAVDLDWLQSAKDVTLNDVESQHVGSQTNSSQKFVRKQTNVYLRTIRAVLRRFFQFMKIKKP